MTNSKYGDKMTNSNTAVAAGIAGLVLLWVGLLIFGPFFTIWSLNTLFHLAIPVTFKTWLSVVWIGGFFTWAGSGNKGSNS